MPRKSKPKGKTSDRQKRFAKEIVKSPRKPRRAAIRAGYSQNSASLMAAANLQNADVQELIIAEAREHLANASMDAADVLVQALSHKAIGVRMQAAREILDRTGVMPKRDAGKGNASLHVTINLTPTQQQQHVDPTPVIDGEITDRGGGG